MKKKMMAAVLFCAMIIALSVPALGAVTISGDSVSGISSASSAISSDSGYNLEFQSVMNDVTLNLTIEGTPYVVLNPYAIAVSASIAGDSSATKNQIIGGDMKITSKTTVPVIIGVKDLQGTVSGNAVLAGKTLDGDTRTTTNSMFLFVSVAKSFAEALQNKDVDKNDLTGTVLISTSPTTKANLWKIDAGSASSPQYAHLTICGNAVKSPTNSWASTDGVTVKFTLTAKMAELAS